MLLTFLCIYCQITQISPHRLILMTIYLTIQTEIIEHETVITDVSINIHSNRQCLDNAGNKCLDGAGNQMICCGVVWCVDDMYFVEQPYGAQF